MTTKKKKLTKQEEERIKHIMKGFPDGTTAWEILIQSWEPYFASSSDMKLLIKKAEADGVRIVE